ncbi:MAG: hypothetical protein ABI808_00240, partial [Pseudonocardiales bacterium]
PEFLATFKECLIIFGQVHVYFKLQRRVAGQSGFQHFFTQSGRAFCLYVVLGSHQRAAALCPEVNAVLAPVEVMPA